jgi:rubrerythrin
VSSSIDSEHGALHELSEDPGSRRSFLRMTGAGAAGALGVLIAACGGDDMRGSAAGEPASAEKDGSSTGAMSARRDLDIVNYALTLEYIEADFYDQVLESGAIGDKTVVELAKEIGEHERQHVDALAATVKKLGGTPAMKPRTAFQSVLSGGPTKILETAATVENLGAAAYLGQAGRIKDKEILAAALSIHTVEARHAAALNELVGRDFRAGSPLDGSLPDGAFAAPMSMEQVMRRVKPFLAS